MSSSSSQACSSLSSAAASDHYDAIVIGAGHNGLTCACYLAKAGLQVLVVEQHSSIGGMTITEDVTLPGFKSDVHAYGYQLANFSPAPTELELDQYGFELLYPEPSISHLFPSSSNAHDDEDDHGGHIISMYRDVNKTIKSIEKYSTKDAHTWEKMFNSYLHNDKNNIVHSLNSPPSSSPLLLPSYSSSSSDLNKQTNLENKQELKATVDSEYRSKIQSLRSWCNEYFESDEAKVFFGAWPAHVCASPDDAGGGNLAYLFSVLVQDGGNNVVKGGMVNLPLALSRYLQARGGRIITGSGVSKIIVNNKDRKAIGIRLDNGREIAIRRLVVSSTDPITLVFNLIGQEYFDSYTIQNLKRYEWGDAILTMYLALDSQMRYNISSSYALQSAHVHLSEPSLDYFAKVFYECRSGKLPSEPFIIVSNDSIADPSRAPTGMHLMKLLLPGIPYKIKHYHIEEDNTMKSHLDQIKKEDNHEYNDWYGIKNEYSEKVIDMISEKYISNLNGILKKKIVYSPIDLEKNPTTSVRGTLSCGAMLPYQILSMRPIPQLSGYRIPDISNVYICGSANHPGPGVSMAPGRNAAQVIYADLGLDFKKLAIQ